MNVMMNSNNFCWFLIVLVTTLNKIDAGCLSTDWVQFKEDKCVRVVDSLFNHPDAELACQEYNSTLLSITSFEEQQFISNLLFTELDIFDNVWLGAVRVNSTTFQWTDGSPWTFDNWKEESPSDVEGNYCAQMVPQGGRQDDFNTFDPSPSGLWSDVACGRRNLVVCQKEPTFSLEELTALFFQHRKRSETDHKEQEKKLDEAYKKLEEQKIKLEEANLKISQVEQNPVPLGFIYTQLSGQPEPSVIWPTVTWTQVTQDYAGLFFRAEGGNSSTFGQAQNDQSPRLSRVVFKRSEDPNWGPQDISVPERGASEFVYTASDSIYFANGWGSYQFFMSFHNSGGEVRPKNQAVRLWKRTA